MGFSSCPFSAVTTPYIGNWGLTSDDDDLMMMIAPSSVY